MKLVHWTFLLVSLGVVGAGLYLYLTYPFLVVPTPWGPWPFYLVLPAAYALGFLVGGLYALALWLSGLGARRVLLQGEVNALKRERIEEIPRIPDREDL
jgi:hypothetical protein